MARLPYIDPAAAPEPVRDALERLPAPLHVFRMMAHAETSFRPLLRLGASILAKQQLSGRLREMAILRVAKLSPAPYEWVQHVPIAKAAGVSADQIAALDRGDITAACFATREQLVLRFTDELVHGARVSDQTFGLTTQHFSPREIVELILAVGYYMLIARLLETTAVDLEPDAGTALVAALE